MHNNQRFDLEDYNAQLAAARADEHFYTQRFLSDQAYILKGFTISSSYIGQPTADVSLTSATLINGNNTGDISWWTAETSPDPLTLPTGVGGLITGRNYVELQIYAENGTPLQRAFWDPSANSGEGQEFTQEVDTVTEMRIRVVVNQTGFNSGNPNLIPLAIIDLDDASNIQGIRDRRELFYRLATSTNVDAGFSWSSRTIPATTLIFTSPAGTAFEIDETVTFSSGATATVLVAGTDLVQVFGFSNDNFEPGDTVTGGTSGATATLEGYHESFTGADKDISNIRDMFAALMTEIRLVKGTRFWHEAGGAASLPSVLNYINALITPIATDAKLSWSGTALSITDAAVSGQTSADVVGAIRIPGYSGNVYLTRQDGTGGSSTITIPDGSLLYVELPVAGSSRSFSETGSGAANYRIATRAGFTPTDSNFVLAYREGSKLLVKGMGELESGEVRQIGDEVSQDLLDYIGVANEATSGPAYSSTTTITPGTDLTSAIGELDERVGELSEIIVQGQNVSLLGGGTWKWVSSTNTLSWSSDAYVDIAGLPQTANLIEAGDISTLDSDGKVAYVAVNRTTPGGSLTVSVSAVDALVPTDDTFIIARRVGDSVIIANQFKLSDQDSFELSGVLQEIERRLDQLKVTADPSSSNLVNISGADSTLLDAGILSQTLSGLVLDFGGAVIDFETGSIFEEDGVTSLGVDFTPETIPANEYFWYGIALDVDVVTAGNQATAQVTITPASSSNSVPASAPFPKILGKKKLGAVQVRNNAGSIEVVTVRRLGADAGSEGGSGTEVAAIDWRDAVSTSLPSSVPLTGYQPDGSTSVSVGDTVLFSNLDTDNNSVHELSVLEVSPLDTWGPHSAAEANEWRSLVWAPEMSLFVAVASSGTNRVMYSPDGISWGPATAPGTNQWYSIAWSPELNRFVAVSPDGTNRVMVSPTGVASWSAISSADDLSTWSSVTWSSELGLFAAVASTGSIQVMTSSDGLSWDPQSAAEAGGWNGIIWVSELELFVAVASSVGTNRVMTSPDGINWTARAAAEANNWHSIAWSPELELLVAVASSGTNRVMTSPDGINWTARAAAEANGWISVTWAPEIGLFVAVAFSGTNRVMTSPDGINWTARAAAEANGWSSMVWAPSLNRFVAVSIDGTNRVMTLDPDLTPTWNEVSAFSDSSLTPAPEEQVRIANGAVFGSQLGTFDGSTFKFNETVRYIKGTNYWEHRALESKTLADNATTALESLESNGEDSYIIHYSITRNSAKEVGTTIINVLGTAVDVVTTASSIGACGFNFSAAVSSGNVNLSGTLDDSSVQDGTLKYSIKRW